MKKLLSVLMAIVLILTVFAGCSNLGKKDNADTSTDAVTAQAESTDANSSETTASEKIKVKRSNAAEINFGKVSGGKYINDSLGIEFEIPKGYKELTPEEIAKVYETEVDSETGKAYTEKPDSDKDVQHFVDAAFENDNKTSIIVFTLSKRSVESSLVFSDSIPYYMNFDYKYDKEETYEYIDIAGNSFANDKTIGKGIDHLYTGGGKPADYEIDRMHILSKFSKDLFSIHYQSAIDYSELTFEEFLKCFK